MDEQAGLGKYMSGPRSHEARMKIQFVSCLVLSSLVQLTRFQNFRAKKIQYNHLAQPFLLKMKTLRYKEIDWLVQSQAYSH